MANKTHADPSDIAPWVAANARLGLCRALVTHVRQQVLAGEHDRALLARELRAQARQAAALLERGSVNSAAEEPAPAKVVCVRPELCLADEHVATGRSAAGAPHDQPDIGPACGSTGLGAAC